MECNVIMKDYPETEVCRHPYQDDNEDVFAELSEQGHTVITKGMKIIKNLTEEQKTVIRRDFLVKHLSEAVGVSKKSYLMLEFASLHFPEEVTATENRYNNVYQKRHERILERLEALNKVEEVQDEQEIQKIQEVA